MFLTEQTDYGQKRSRNLKTPSQSESVSLKQEPLKLIHG